MERNKIKYGVFSDITGNKPMLICEDKNKAMDFCYSQNKNLYPKEIMILSPLYCFIRKVEVNYKGDIIRIIKGWKDRKILTGVDNGRCARRDNTKRERAQVSILRNSIDISRRH